MSCSCLQVVNLTDRILPPLTRNRRIIIAASINLNKFFFLDCEDGNVYVGTRNLPVDGEMMVCVPEQASASEEESQDGMLRWLENYAHCLQSGMFQVRTEQGSQSISLYPDTEPYCTTAVTRGVQVCLIRTTSRIMVNPNSLRNEPLVHAVAQSIVNHYTCRKDFEFSAELRLLIHDLDLLPQDTYSFVLYLIKYPFMASAIFIGIFTLY